MIIEIPDEDVDRFLASLKRVQRNKEVRFLVEQMEKLRHDEWEVTRLWEANDVEGMKRLVSTLRAGFWHFQALCFIQQAEQKEQK